MDKFNEFLETLKDAPNAEELLGGKFKPQDEREVIAAYVSAAKALGFDISAQDVVDGVEALVQERLEKTDQLENEVEELSNDGLDAVAGGWNCNCESTYEDYENCWWSDGCDLANNHYGVLYKCKRAVNGEHRHRICDEMLC